MKRNNNWNDLWLAVHDLYKTECALYGGRQTACFAYYNVLQLIDEHKPKAKAKKSRKK